MTNRGRLALAALPVVIATAISLPPAAAVGGHSAVATSGKCPAGPIASTVPSIYNHTPHAPNPWSVPIDPCNSEATAGAKHPPYYNCAYWAAEKRPDLWRNAVLPYGYTHTGGAWDVELDARRAGYHISHTPRAGDVAAWRPNARMGTEAGGRTDYASPGGHVVYVEKVLSRRHIRISEMGVTAAGGYTIKLHYSRHTYFIHRGRSAP